MSNNRFLDVPQTFKLQASGTSRISSTRGRSFTWDQDDTPGSTCLYLCDHSQSEPVILSPNICYVCRLRIHPISRIQVSSPPALSVCTHSRSTEMPTQPSTLKFKTASRLLSGTPMCRMNWAHSLVPTLSADDVSTLKKLLSHSCELRCTLELNKLIFLGQRSGGGVVTQ